MARSLAREVNETIIELSVSESVASQERAEKAVAQAETPSTFPASPGKVWIAPLSANESPHVVRVPVPKRMKAKETNRTLKRKSSKRGGGMPPFAVSENGYIAVSQPPGSEAPSLWGDHEASSLIFNHGRGMRSSDLVKLRGVKTEHAVRAMLSKYWPEAFTMALLQEDEAFIFAQMRFGEKPVILHRDGNPPVAPIIDPTPTSDMFRAVVNIMEQVLVYNSNSFGGKTVRGWGETFRVTNGVEV